MNDRIMPSGLKGRWLAMVAVSLATAGLAQQKPVADEIAAFLNDAKPRRGHAAAAGGPVEASRSSQAGDGHLTYVGAPPGHHFTVARPGGAGPSQEAVAKAFLREHGRLFGVRSAAVEFRAFKKSERPDRTSVRLEQTYAGLPVVAAEMVVQVNAEGGVDAVLSDIARETALLDEGKVPLRPTLSREESSARLREHLDKESVRGLQIQPGELEIFAPVVLDAPGPIRLVWELGVSGAGKDGPIHERALVDAHSGEVVRRFTLIHSALNRRVYDANCTTSDPGTLVRSEGQPPSGVADADDAYDFLGDTYDFYLTEHTRDSIDNGGMILEATVRLAKDAVCSPPDGLAYYSANSNRMYYGRGYVSDDVTAHELTHAVTAHTSQLIYENDAGAINEAFSDIWGEFVDLGNGRGTDTAAVRWLIGEDIVGGALRNMTNPPAFAHPDRYGSSSYGPPATVPSPANDYGGVHTNSGIINKLCVLLTDGATFNGLTIQGYGIPRVADLFYEVNTAPLLTQGANYRDLFNALRQAAVNLGWTAAERHNLLTACVAVEIGGVYVDKTYLCLVPNGGRRCRSLGGGPYTTVAVGLSAVAPGEHLGIVAGTYSEQFTRLNKPMTIRALEGPVTIGR